jgi:hypothetical protein
MRRIQVGTNSDCHVDNGCHLFSADRLMSQTTLDDFCRAPVTVGKYCSNSGGALVDMGVEVWIVAVVSRTSTLSHLSQNQSVVDGFLNNCKRE